MVNRTKTKAGLWTAAQKADVESQYMMMAVCLTCHEDDRNNQCNQCHTGWATRCTFCHGGRDNATGAPPAGGSRASVTRVQKTGRKTVEKETAR